MLYSLEFVFAYFPIKKLMEWKLYMALLYTHSKFIKNVQETSHAFSKRTKYIGIMFFFSQFEYMFWTALRIEPL